MQPETTVLKLAEDVNTRLTEQQCGVSSEMSAELAAASDKPRGDGANLLDASIPICKVVPMYTPYGAVIKLFCVHPSHRLASSLTNIASGFQFQVKFSSFTKGEHITWTKGNKRAIGLNFLVVLSIYIGFYPACRKLTFCA